MPKSLSELADFLFGRGALRAVNGEPAPMPGSPAPERQNTDFVRAAAEAAGKRNEISMLEQAMKRHAQSGNQAAMQQASEQAMALRHALQATQATPVAPAAPAAPPSSSLMDMFRGIIGR